MFAAQGAEDLHLGLVRQVGDDALVGLQPPQDVGAHQVAQRLIGIVRATGEPFDEGRERFGRPQQPRIDEVEDRPQVAEPVLDGRTGQGDARVGFETLGEPGLFGCRIFDRLCLVENNEPPRRDAEPRRARQKTVARDDEIGVTEVARAIHLQFAAGRRGWMRHDGLQAGRKSRDLGGPVGEQRCRGDEEARLATSLLLQHQEQRLLIQLGDSKLPLVAIRQTINKLSHQLKLMGV